MARRVARRAGGRWWRLLALLASAAGTAVGTVAAQTASQPAPPPASPAACAPRAPWWLSRRHWVAPSIVRWSGGALLVLGRPAFAPSTTAGVSDTALAGIVVQPSGRVTRVPLVDSMFEFSDPRAVARADGGLEVLWADSAEYRPAGALRLRRTIHVATLARGRWSRHRALGTWETPLPLYRNVASDVVTIGGANHFVFPVSLVPGRATERLAVASDSGGRWRVHLHDVGLDGVGLLTAGVDHGRLTVLFNSPQPVVPPEGGTFPYALYASVLDSGRWSPPQLVGGTHERGVSEPVLLQAGDRVIAAWVHSGGRSGAGPSLEWREIAGGKPVGAVQRLPGVYSLRRGLAPHDDLVSALTIHHRTLVLRLRPDAHDLIADLPTVFVTHATIASVRGRPTAVTSATRDPDSVPEEERDVELVAYDLTCALRPRGAPLRR